MDKTLQTILLASIFGGGGFYVGFNLAKKKYQDLADLEVEAVKRSLIEHYKKKNETVDDRAEEKDISSDESVKEDIENYKDYSKRYSSEASKVRILGGPKSYEKELTKEEVGVPDGPYVITAADFQESPYEARTLYLFVDRVLADEDYNILTHVEDTVGEEAIGILISSDEDCVYVRNDELSIDYEILLDERYFSKASPTPVPGVMDPD